LLNVFRLVFDANYQNGWRPKYADYIDADTGEIKKGDVLTLAEVAGIQAAKQTANLIPLCHTLLLNKVKVEAALTEKGVEVSCLVRSQGKTGVEMEALTAASTAALTLYDMCKAVDKGMTINQVQLLEKKGGKSGYWKKEAL